MSLVHGFVLILVYGLWIFEAIHHRIQGRLKRVSFVVPAVCFLMSILAVAQSVPYAWGFALASWIWFLLSFPTLFYGAAEPMSVWLLFALLAPEGLGVLGINILKAYLGLSYLLSAFQKLRFEEWRDGRALVGFLSVARVQSKWREWIIQQSAEVRVRLQWAILGGQILMGVSVFLPSVFWLGFTLAVGFHAINGVLFGLWRFFWVWMAAWALCVV